MRFLSALLVLVFFSACALQFAHSGAGASKTVLPEEKVNSTGEAAGKQPVLIELFTSEGCSSCPPAERLLAKFQKEQPIEGAEIITMALHVDYWDELGWKDRFASPLFTQRQRVYDRKFRTGNIYTPQMIVDGETEFVGSNKEKAEKAVKAALKNEKVDVNLLLSENALEIDIPQVSGHDAATLYLAFTEDELTSDVKRGENAGKNLTHLSLVRKLQALGRLDKDDNSYSIKAPMHLEPEWKKENVSVIVFLQENVSRKVLGVAKLSANDWSTLLR